MPKESGMGNRPQNRPDTISELEAKLKQIEASILEREEQGISPDPFEQGMQNFVLKDLKKIRNEYLESIKKLSKKK